MSVKNKRPRIPFSINFLNKNILTRFVCDVLAWILVWQIFVHVFISHAQRIVQHGELLYGVSTLQDRLDFSFDVGLGCEINLKNRTEMFKVPLDSGFVQQINLVVITYTNKFTYRSKLYVLLLSVCRYVNIVHMYPHKLLYYKVYSINY